MSDLTAGLEKLIEQLHTNTLPEMSEELKALATEVLRRIEERKDENIEEWAMRLAKDVADAND